MMKSLLGSSRKPDVTFHHDGRIDITARVAHKLGILPGDVIDVSFDGIEYFLYIRHRGTSLTGKHEAQCFPTKRHSHNFRAHSVRLCRDILRISRSSCVARLSVGESERHDGKTYLTLIICNQLTIPPTH